MSKIKGIPLSGGLLTNSDLEEVDIDYSSDLVNVDFDKPGALSIRPQIGLPKSLPWKVKTLYRWKDKVKDVEDTDSAEALWIAIVESSETNSSNKFGREVYSSIDGNNWQLWTYIDRFDIEPEIMDLGGSLRILTGHSDYVLYIDYIDRKFFGGLVEFSGYYIDDNAIPDAPFIFDSVEASAGGHNVVNDYYYYKIVPVFDGVQIGGMSKAGYKKLQITGSNKTVKMTITLPASTTGGGAEDDVKIFNPRLTHLNIYRGHATVDNVNAITYYLVNSINTMQSMADDGSGTQFNVDVRTCASLGASNLGNGHGSGGSYDGQCILGTGEGVAYGNQTLCEDAGGTWNTSPYNIVANSASSARAGFILLTGLQGNYLTTGGPFKSNLYRTIMATKCPISEIIRWTWKNTDDYWYGTNFQGAGWKNNSDVQHIMKTGGKHTRQIERVEQDYVVTQAPFWRDFGNETVEWEDVGGTGDKAEQKKSQYCWGQGSETVRHAIISNINKLAHSSHPHRSGGHADNHGWSKYDQDDSWGAVKGHGSNSNEEHGYFLYGHDTSGGHDNWDKVTYYQHITMEENSWYWITCSAQWWYSGPDHYSSRTEVPSLMIRTGHNTGSETADYGHANTKFHGWMDLAETSNNDYIQCGWWYYHTTGTACTFSLGQMDSKYIGAGVGHHKFAMSYPGVFKVVVGPTKQGYFGADVIVGQKNLIAPTAPSVSMAPGSALRLTNDIDQSPRVVVATTEQNNYEMYQLEPQYHETIGLKEAEFTATYDLSQDEATGDISCSFTDPGYMDGEQHSSQGISTNCRYKFAKMLSGRLFVANVLLEPGTDNEEKHPNWILFSELNRPDVIPITNYLAVSDLGGGEITKLAEITGNLVIFSKNNIYRLNVPSYDPTQWSLMEATSGIGAEARDGIIDIRGALFFCAKDNVYMMDANFIPQPISNTIKNIYQDEYTRGIKLIFDSIKNRLFIIFESKEIYCMHMNRFPKEEVWQRLCFVSGFSGESNPSSIVFDEEFKAHLLFDDYEQTNSPAIVELESKGNPHEPLSMLKSTGWMRLSTPDMNVVVGKLHVRYKSSANLNIMFHTDFESESDHVKQSQKFDVYQNDNVTIKASSGTKPGAGPKVYTLDANCDSSGKLLEVDGKKSKLHETVRLGIRCSSLKMTIYSDEQTSFCDIYSMELEHE